MTLAALQKYCLAKPGTSADFPFDFETLVLRVGTKIFALTNTKQKPLYVNLKCEPFLALQLREQYPAVTPGYHMNKVHWNTVLLDGSVPDDVVRRMVDHSYELVFKGLKSSEKKSITAQG